MLKGYTRILDVIFAKLDVPDLKTSRLVCQDWADVGATFLGKRTLLGFNKLFSEPNFGEVSHVNDKLMRRVHMWVDCYKPITSLEKNAEFFKKAFSELTKVSQLIREIHFVSMRNELVPVWLEGFRALGSTKIQNITILCYQITLYTIPAEALQKLPPQPGLTSVKCIIHSSFRETPRSPDIQALLQIWIDSAPNLTTLDAMAFFYPNLEGCKNLKVLKFRLIPHHVNFGNAYLSHVTKMLGQVKDSLIELELGNWLPQYGSMGEITVEELPIMSKLTTLSIYAIDAYRFHGFFDEDHFPKLKTLSFHSGHLESPLITHLFYWRRHRGVQSLSLTVEFGEEREMEFSGIMIPLFPAVKEFDFVMKFNSIPALSRILRPFRLWALERGNVLAKNVGQTSTFIRVLEAISACEGDKVSS
ncbi:uncharacterized protein LOC118438135 [Folsomia candida]|uniref:uncharacterized protein LOC118438135 n=1 Tax=Folsomia candida TaxID=158441 RepID=UPI001604F308|nr:uncharacterized protein LOC118438135 [Folsomia candida]